MAIDVESEELIPFQFAGEAFPKGVKPPCKQTLHRYRKPPGVRGKVLDSVMIGGIRYTSREAILRFCSDSSNTTPAVTQAQRSRRTSSALKALASMGIE